MPTYDVLMRRAEYREHTFRVKADNQDAAIEEVEQELIPDHDWHMSVLYHGDESVIAVTAVEEPDPEPEVDPGANDLEEALQYLLSLSTGNLDDSEWPDVHALLKRHGFEVG